MKNMRLLDFILVVESGSLVDASAPPSSLRLLELDDIAIELE